MQLQLVRQNFEKLLSGKLNMQRFVVTVAVVGICLLVLGAFLRDATVFLAGLVGIGAAAFCVWLQRRRSQERPDQPATVTKNDNECPQVARAKAALSHASDATSLVSQMIQDGRYALLLRDQIVGNLSEEEVTTAVAELDDKMALVASGPVCLGLTDPNPEDGEEEFCGWARPSIAGRLVMVDPLFLGRYCVSNSDYQNFVSAGGYEQMSLWDEEALPALLDFVDQTGEPGPRFWRNGKYGKGQAKRPVVGVSWFEANAYARWCGQRLPSDAEWVKAASWPVESSPGHLVHRRYPWGDEFDSRRANLWCSGNNGVVDVDDIENGASVAGAVQLIGNVWEWTASPYGDPEDATLRLSIPMRSIRGGAYDTYFENQATCHYQSGENPLSRKHNVGFRVALGSCDVAAGSPDVAEDTEEPAEQELLAGAAG